MIRHSLEIARILGGHIHLREIHASGVAGAAAGSAHWRLIPWPQQTSARGWRTHDHRRRSHRGHHHCVHFVLCAMHIRLAQIAEAVAPLDRLHEIATSLHDRKMMSSRWSWLVMVGGVEHKSWHLSYLILTTTSRKLRCKHSNNTWLEKIKTASGRQGYGDVDMWVYRWVLKIRSFAEYLLLDGGHL